MLVFTYSNLTNAVFPVDNWDNSADAGVVDAEGHCRALREEAGAAGEDLHAAERAELFRSGIY